MARRCRPLVARRASRPPSSSPPSPCWRGAGRRSASAAGCAPSPSTAAGLRRLPSPEDAGLALGHRATAVVLAVPAPVAAQLLPGIATAGAAPRHRQRPFRVRAARPACRPFSAWSAARPNGSSPIPAGSRPPPAGPTGCSRRRARGAGGAALARRPGSAGVESDPAGMADRQGAARHLRRPCRAGAAAAARGDALVATWCWPATTLPPACRRRSKARSARAMTAADAIEQATGAPVSRPRSEGCPGMTMVSEVETTARLGPAGARPGHRRRQHGAVRSRQQGGRPLGVRAGGGRDHSGRIHPAAPLSPRARATLKLEAGIAAICAASSGTHGGWPLFEGGALRRQRQRQGLFRPEDDRRRPRRCRIWRGRARRSSPMAGGAQQCLHPHPAGALRGRALARRAGDAGGDHAAAALVPVPPSARSPTGPAR